MTRTLVPKEAASWTLLCVRQPQALQGISEKELLTPSASGSVMVDQ